MAKVMLMRNLPIMATPTGSQTTSFTPSGPSAMEISATSPQQMPPVMKVPQ